MAGVHFLAVFVLIADCDPAGWDIDRSIRRVRETRPFLNVVIADNPEGAMLRKDRRLLSRP
jgi:hypothetical protein